MLESYGWKLLGVEGSNPESEDLDFSEEIEDLIDRTRTNPNAIIDDAPSEFAHPGLQFLRGTISARRDSPN